MEELIDRVFGQDKETRRQSATPMSWTPKSWQPKQERGVQFESEVRTVKSGPRIHTRMP